MAIEEKITEQISTEKITTPAPEALKESIDYIIRHASERDFLRKKNEKLNIMRKN
jgi:hypothetical protein